ncbi:glycosyltransferase family 4 protein [Clostridium hydrogenum]|uniref:glycosyltransferase family 4 protein n=1 Tax=Clostridium hydrogenum TaxID=2855764 RepID=UPI001F2339F1|nr:glycosyltransferase family 4 protein [Clostridium hydrogenum]
MKALFFDLKNDGHHFFYNHNVMKLQGVDTKYYVTSNSIENEKEELLNNDGVTVVKIKALASNNRIIRMFSELLVLFKMRKMIHKLNIDVAILLYLDHIIIPLYMLQVFLPVKSKLIATLHWFPNRSSKLKLLKKLSDKGLRVIVHTEDVKKRLEAAGINNVELVYYPTLKTSSIDKLTAKNKLNLKLVKEYKTILYFGGTRFDKGVDILLDALEKVNSSANIIIAGQEQTFKREFIEEKLSHLANKNVVLNLGYVKDEEVELYFKSSDIVVLPYRKIFNGESGILTEAINNKNLVVVPNIIHFPSVVSKYSNGVIYEAENIVDLGEKLQYTIKNIDVFQSGIDEAFEDYKEKHSIKNFIKNYEKIIIKGK